MLKSEFVEENPNRLISCEERLPEEPYPCIVIVNGCQFHKIFSTDKQGGRNK